MSGLSRRGILGAIAGLLPTAAVAKTASRENPYLEDDAYEDALRSMNKRSGFHVLRTLSEEETICGLGSEGHRYITSKHVDLETGERFMAVRSCDGSLLVIHRE